MLRLFSPHPRRVILTTVIVCELGGLSLVIGGFSLLGLGGILLGLLIITANFCREVAATQLEEAAPPQAGEGVCGRDAVRR